MRAALCTAVMVTTAAWTAGARAEPPGLGGPSDSPLVAPGHVRLDVGLEASLTHRELWKPVSIAPDVYVGVPWTGRFPTTVGLYHSTRAAGLLDSGNGLCFGGRTRNPDGGCPDRYRGLGIDVMTRLWASRGWLTLARVRVDVQRFSDPSKPRLVLGGVVRWGQGRLSVLADPHVAIGLIHRDRGNRSTVGVPVWIGVGLVHGVQLFFRTGVDGPVPGFADTYAIPLGMGVSVGFGPHWRAELQAALPEIGGPLNSPRPRDLLFRVSWAP